MAIKLTVFFSQIAGRSTGWSENFWNSGPTDFSSTTLTKCNDLIAMLLATKGPETIGIGHRITLYSAAGFPVGQSQTITPASPPSNNSANAGATYESDYPTISLLLECRSVNGQATRQWLHGIDDSSLRDGGRYKPQSGYKASVAALTSYLKRAEWGMRVMNKATSPKRRLFEIKQTAPHIFTTVDNHGLVADDRIKVYRCYDPYKTGVNGTWHVLPLAADPAKSFLLVGFLPLAEQTVLATGASYIKKQTFEFLAGDWEVLRATSKQVGRPFGSPSGRRKGVKRSQI